MLSRGVNELSRHFCNKDVQIPNDYCRLRRMISRLVRCFAADDDADLTELRVDAFTDVEDDERAAAAVRER